MENLQTENILNLRDDIVISEAELRHIVTSEMIRVGLMPSLTGFRYFKEMVNAEMISAANPGNIPPRNAKRSDMPKLLPEYSPLTFEFTAAVTLDTVI